VFVSNWGTKDYAGGSNDQGQMVLEGTIGYAGNGRVPFRGTWSLNADGTVTQDLQEYTRESKAWENWFTGVYRSKTRSVP
jgi:hypothetical protein